jgi:glutamate dehydrogenase (NAD(P)+)
MIQAINDVWHKSSEKECTLRTAFILGCERILKARKERGIFPG